MILHTIDREFVRKIIDNDIAKICKKYKRFKLKYLLSICVLSKK